MRFALLVLLACVLCNVAAARPFDERAEVQNVVARAKAASYQTTEPLIGILTQPCHDCPGRSYIAASYVKWVEAAGGRVVPIRFYATDHELERLFRTINGLVFPGGLTWLWLDAPYVITARKLFNMAVAANDKGDIFPIHGTCLGFQLLHILVSNVSRNDLLIETDSVSHPSTLEFTGAEKDSKMFSYVAPDLIGKLEDPALNLAIQNHEYGMPPPFYKRWPVLAEWYNILTTSKDRNGVEYISTMEGKKYPFTGTQWHPEKPTSEFGMEEVPHTLDAIRVSQGLANYFIDTARYSSHKPESHEQELADLIYSTKSVFSARFEVFGEDNYDGPYQTYYFDSKTPPPIGPEDDERNNRLDSSRSSSRPGLHRQADVKMSSSRRSQQVVAA